MNNNEELLSLYSGAELEAVKQYLADPEAGYTYQDDDKIEPETSNNVPFEPTKAASADTSKTNELSKYLEALVGISDVPRDCFACGKPASTLERHTVISRRRTKTDHAGQTDHARVFCIACLSLPASFKEDADWKMQRAFDLLEQGMTQKVICAELGVSQSAISKWKNLKKNIPKAVN